MLKICQLHKNGTVTDWMEAPWNLKLKAQGGKQSLTGIEPNNDKN
jgi:hypothetical protein